VYVNRYPCHPVLCQVGLMSEVKAHIRAVGQRDRTNNNCWRGIKLINMFLVFILLDSRISMRQGSHHIQSLSYFVTGYPCDVGSMLFCTVIGAKHPLTHMYTHADVIQTCTYMYIYWITSVRAQKTSSMGELPLMRHLQP
jgi:hypothetical protein